MSAELPDVSLADSAKHQSPLSWVGMNDIDLPVSIAEDNCVRTIHARADVHVDLPAAHVKGIHMSRLYRLLDQLTQGAVLSPHILQQLLGQMVESHRSCETGNARLRLCFDLLVKRPALLTKGLSGWKSYPVRIDAVLRGKMFECRVEVSVAYSSTCPCSAALSRQMLEQAFQAQFGAEDRIDPDEVSAWLRDHGTLATPHSQRSQARVSVLLGNDMETLGLLELIDCVEAALGTPVQTAVKREDEQAFAALNGQNLMFVEDAARRIEDALDGYLEPSIHVRHFESLHPHDAVAWGIRGSW